MQEPHKAGLLKQENKSHKGGCHRSNRQLHANAKGKVDLKTLTKRGRKDLTRDDRRNQVKQLQRRKRDE